MSYILAPNAMCLIHTPCVMYPPVPALCEVNNVHQRSEIHEKGAFEGKLCMFVILEKKGSFWTTNSRKSKKGV